MCIHLVDTSGVLKGYIHLNLIGCVLVVAKRNTIDGSTMKCPNCGYEPPIGRPKKLNDGVIKKLKRKGASLAKIAEKFGVTRGAIHASLKRTTPSAHRR